MISRALHYFSLPAIPHLIVLIKPSQSFDFLFIFVAVIVWVSPFLPQNAVFSYFLDSLDLTELSAHHCLVLFCV